ncbi:MAG: ATP-binding protein [Desulfobacteraceae bacterium]
MRSKLKLQAQLFFSVVLVVGTVLVILFSVIAVRHKASLEKNTLHEFYLKTGSMTRRLGQLMFSGNFRHMMITLKGEMKNDPRMLYFFVTDPRGKIVVADDEKAVGRDHFQRVPSKADLPDPLFENFLRAGGRDEDRVRFKAYKTCVLQDIRNDGSIRAEKGEKIFDTFWDIYYMDRQVGSLRTGFSTKAMEEDAASFQRSLVVSGVLLLGVVMLLILFVVRKSMAPLEQLTAKLAMLQDTADGTEMREELEHLTIDHVPSASYEIEHLILAFEKLGELFKTNWDQLERHRNNLEHMVHERTAELKSANEELTRRIEERAEIEDRAVNSQRLETVGMLAGGIAHDFNNLFMAIQGNASLIKRKTDPDSPASLKADKIAEIVNQGAEVIRQLLGFARGGKYNPVPLNINDIVDSHLKMFLTTRKELSIQRSYDKEILPVEADQGQIGQVVLNLLLNASDAMPGKGTLMVTTRNLTLETPDVAPHDLPPGRYVNFSVGDSGTGMDDKMLEQIFDPFFTTKQMGHGTGMGLASAWGIIRNHNGFITVESTVNQGSLFSVFLPAAEKSQTRKGEDS